MQIVHENPGVLFHFFGIHAIAQSNIGAAVDTETHLVYQPAAGYGNVKMHGVLNTVDLANALNQMDALLICYDMQPGSK